MKKILICVFICLPLIAWGQKKTMTQVKDYIKSGKNLDKAEKLMTDLLNDSSSRGNEKVWLLLFESQRKQYDQGNEKLYLKEMTQRLFSLWESACLIRSKALIRSTGFLMHVER